MKAHRWGIRHACLGLAVTLMIACGRREEPDVRDDDVEAADGGDMADAVEGPVKVTEVRTGKGVDSVEEIESEGDMFAPRDTIWASVKTEDTPAGTEIMARWVYTEGGQEQVIAEETHTTARAGSGHTSFFAAKDGDWPAGSYEVRIEAGGETETAKFDVEQ